MTTYINDRVQIDISDYLDLLETKLDALNRAKQEDSSWSYDTEGIQKLISDTKEQMSFRKGS